MTSQKTNDFFVAHDVHRKFNCLGVTENAILPEKENYEPRTLVDHTLELIDPTPNIYTLFVQFNARFFLNVLAPVEVKWSNRMTSCAGTCSFHNKQCVITLSEPLLKLRPRKDLVETLLHEMIHAYLFLTNNNRDRDGHGPNFCEHMYRINKEAGTNITIYHNFHDEVRLYQQHWWKCNGPCRFRSPFFGMVRRVMNRAPGPSDYWWAEHKLNCNGQFIKIKEPENYKSKQKDKSKSTSKNNMLKDNTLVDWFARNSPTIDKSSLTFKHPKVFTHNQVKRFTQTITQIDRSKTANNKDNSKSDQDSLLGVKKLGNTSNNVHGWNISGPSGKIEKDNTKHISSKTPMFSCFGTLGGSNNGQSRLLKEFLHVGNSKNRPNELNEKYVLSKLSSATECFRKPADKPISNLIKSKSQTKRKADNKCNTKSTPLIDKLNNSSNEKLTSPIRPFFTPLEKQTANTSNKRLKLDDPKFTEYASCFICDKMLPADTIYLHTNECLSRHNKAYTGNATSNSQPQPLQPISQIQFQPISQTQLQPISNLDESRNQVEKKTDSKYNTNSTSFIDKLNNSRRLASLIRNNKRFIPRTRNNKKLIPPVQLFLTPLRLHNVMKIQLTNRDNEHFEINDSDDYDDDTEFKSCYFCKKVFPADDIHMHINECFSDDNEAIWGDNKVPSNVHASDDSIINISSSSNSDSDNSGINKSPKAQSCIDINASESSATNCEQKCLVCNAQIASDTTLSEHLDECIGAIFNDNTIMIDDKDDGNMSATGKNSIEDKYPCPVCKELISENLMNRHLDTCLENNSTD
ncbi:uncharacterized protein LOC105192440 isoform X1 [Harpegnathos saltator]|uniref:Protein with SprT-like domain at the N terminus n=1 Tax=Harpegnathos saltator TaxID=610380 RepID=E2B934_HARSA|nr:uncharacterized protein LOC105192440 isoform X1 [Harpegnathos saltator]EFN87800.1 Zinc finger RAD18 domain-containing protein C1orf124-like protein [Harpegnathos saltator]